MPSFIPMKIPLGETSGLGYSPVGLLQIKMTLALALECNYQTFKCSLVCFASAGSAVLIEVKK